MISPYEVENAVLEHPRIIECAVVSVEHSIKGHSLHLYIVLENNFEKDIVSRIKKHGKLYKI